MAIACECRGTMLRINKHSGANVPNRTLPPSMSRKASDPSSHRSRPDRRTARTRQSLHVALNRLVLEKGYQATTIKDITARANVGRSTFYAHHPGKDALLVDGLQHLRDALVRAQRESETSTGDLDPIGFSRAFFEHVNDYRDVYLALVRGESEPMVTSTLKRIVADVLAAGLRRRKDGSSPDIPREALVCFIVDAFFSILRWWLRQAASQPAPADVDALFRRLVLPALNSAQSRP